MNCNDLLVINDFIKNQPVAEYKSLNSYYVEKISEKYGYFCHTDTDFI